MCITRLALHILAPVALLVGVSTLCAQPYSEQALERLSPALEAAANQQRDEALRMLNELIATDPKFAEAYFERAQIYLAQRQPQKAIEDFTRSIEVGFAAADVYGLRGDARQMQEDFAGAITDYTTAIDMPVTFGSRADIGKYLMHRGRAYHRIGQYQKAIDDYHRVRAYQFDDAFNLNHLAELRATCPDRRFRDGKDAVELSRIACGMTQWKDPDMISVYAAAQAEAGDFTEAVRRQQQAIDLLAADAPQAGRAELQRRLTLYQAKRPMRIEPVGKRTD